MIITKARQSGKKCNGFKGCGDNIYIGFEYCKLRRRKCLCKACADKFKPAKQTTMGRLISLIKRK